MDAGQVIEVRLRAAMDRYRRRTGERITYEILAARTGLARSTLESIAARAQYNASLNTIDKICSALGCTPGELLHHRTANGNAAKLSE
ncbi:MAG: helix-turn-helix transcriptional regulator [Pseudomonadota bacterium]|nr:helix-turn-helix transcriptional regulator [Pseudomonadota bacterium]